MTQVGRPLLITVPSESNQGFGALPSGRKRGTTSLRRVILGGEQMSRTRIQQHWKQSIKSLKNDHRVPEDEFAQTLRVGDQADPTPFRFLAQIGSNRVPEAVGSSLGLAPKLHDHKIP